MKVVIIDKKTVSLSDRREKRSIPVAEPLKGLVESVAAVVTAQDRQHRPTISDELTIFGQFTHELLAGRYASITLQNSFIPTLKASSLRQLHAERLTKIPHGSLSPLDNDWH
ncbi:Uncharacterized protein HZ326_1062 [Fusarium oxysporum f. sp. albedinis]|nr:Uncharacterized protein HZ326_1062 [Fusarium oxysporum f. sp. albedinis]